MLSYDGFEPKAVVRPENRAIEQHAGAATHPAKADHQGWHSK
jgi:hypothetical protein